MSMALLSSTRAGRKACGKLAGDCPENGGAGVEGKGSGHGRAEDGGRAVPAEDYGALAVLRAVAGHWKAMDYPRRAGKIPMR